MVDPDFDPVRFRKLRVQFNANQLVERENLENDKKVVEKLNADPELKVEIRGYCDFPGSNDYNLKLSERRINAVKDALVKAGIEESRITTQPQGKLPNPPKAEQKNRRCDFFFSK